MIEEIRGRTEEKIIQEPDHLKNAKLGIVLLIKGACGEIEVTIEVRADANFCL